MDVEGVAKEYDLDGTKLLSANVGMGRERVERNMVVRGIVGKISRTVPQLETRQGFSVQSLAPLCN